MITVDDRATRAWISGLLARVTNLTPALKAIGGTVVANTLLRFRNARGPGGVPWAPLSPTTIARRRNRSDRPLLDTGRLRNSIHSVLEGSNAVVVGTDVVYAAMQHFGARKGQFGSTRRGAPIPWGDVPGRPYLGIDADDVRDITAVLAGYIEGARG